MGNLNRNFGNHSKKHQERAKKSFFGKLMNAIGLSDGKIDRLLGFDKKPRERHNRSKYSPHQGNAECARRIAQGKAGMNLNVVAKPSQDFGKAQTAGARFQQLLKCHPNSKKAIRLIKEVTNG
jgi:hypothetical protein